MLFEKYDQTEVLRYQRVYEIVWYCIVKCFMVILRLILYFLSDDIITLQKH